MPRIKEGTIAAKQARIEKFVIGGDPLAPTRPTAWPWPIDKRKKGAGPLNDG